MNSTYEVFWVWLWSLHFGISRVIHDVCLSVVCSFSLLPECSVVWRGHTWFIHSPAARLFPFVAVTQVSRSGVSLHVRVFVGPACCVSSSCASRPGTRLRGPGHGLLPLAPALLLNRGTAKGVERGQMLCRRLTGELL